MADLPTVTGEAYYNPYQEFDLRGVNFEFTRILDQYANPYLYGITSAPANYVELPKRQDPELPEVVVTGSRPSLAERRYPVVVDNFETHDMNDQELADYYGGGDAGYEQMWEERHPNEPDILFVPPIGLLYPAVGTLATLATSLIGGFIGLFVPSPTAPREIDELPMQPGTPRIPPKIPLPPFTDPILPPNWEDIANEPFNEPFNEWIDIPDLLLPFGDPVERRNIPVPDTPRVPFIDPSMPEFPFPDFEPRPATRPGPSRPTPFPFSDPIPTIVDDPLGNPLDEPYFWPEPKPTERPGPVPDPFVDAPPRIGDPYAPPDVLLPPADDPYAPTRPTGDPNPLRDPFDAFMDQPQPKPKDGCDCVKAKDKKKKKKKTSPREICYEGHYIEHARGLTKVRGKQIPCDSKAARKPRKKTPTLPDLAKDVFGYIT